MALPHLHCFNVTSWVHVSKIRLQTNDLYTIGHAWHGMGVANKHTCTGRCKDIQQSGNSAQRDSSSSAAMWWVSRSIWGCFRWLTYHIYIVHGLSRGTNTQQSKSTGPIFPAIDNSDDMGKARSLKGNAHGKE